MYGITGGSGEEPAAVVDHAVLGPIGHGASTQRMHGDEASLEGAGPQRIVEVGAPGPGHGVPGDLIVLIEEIEHEHLKRNGANLYYDHYINIADAAMGATVEIPTIDSKVNIKIEAGTQSGNILRLKGKGLPRLNQYGKGDILVNICVWTPQSLTSEEKKLLDNLRKSSNFNPQPGKKNKSFFQRIHEMFE